MITPARLKELLRYDPDTGEFTWIDSPSRRMKAGSVAGYRFTDTSGKSYIRITVGGKLYFAHRFAWLFIHGEFPEEEIDHENGDGTDNRLSNLRSVTHAENSKNRRLSTRNTSGHAGVHWDKGCSKWVVKITARSKTRYLGLFEVLSDAIAVRQAAEIELGFHPNHGSIRPL